MTNLLLVIGSARTGRVADKVLSYVQEDIAARENVSATVADLKELKLPFFDAETVPGNPDYAPTNEAARAWSALVKEADGVVFITPEYNHDLSAIQKNAIDTLFADWNDKPATAVAYGWSGGSLAVKALREVLSVVKTDTKESVAQLAFMKDINPDGSLLDEASVRAQIAATLDEITA